MQVSNRIERRPALPVVSAPLATDLPLADTVRT